MTVVVELLLAWLGGSAPGSSESAKVWATCGRLGERGAGVANGAGAMLLPEPAKRLGGTLTNGAIVPAALGNVEGSAVGVVDKEGAKGTGGLTNKGGASGGRAVVGAVGRGGARGTEVSEGSGGANGCEVVLAGAEGLGATAAAGAEVTAGMGTVTEVGVGVAVVGSLLEDWLIAVPGGGTAISIPLLVSIAKSGLVPLFVGKGFGVALLTGGMG